MSLRGRLHTVPSAYTTVHCPDQYRSAAINIRIQSAVSNVHILCDAGYKSICDIQGAKRGRALRDRWEGNQEKQDSSSTGESDRNKTTGAGVARCERGSGSEMKNDAMKPGMHSEHCPA